MDTPAVSAAQAASGGTAASAAPGERSLRAAETCARWLDSYYLDPLLGFVFPGIGDAVGSALGLSIVGIAVRRRSPPAVIARMLLNLSVDGLVGAIPLVGDVLDVFGRANLRNVALLRERPVGAAARPVDWLVLGAAALLFCAALAAPVVLVVWLGVLLWQRL